MSAAEKIFQAGKEAMRAIVVQFPSGSERPEWVTAFINAIGAPSDLAKVCDQVEKDAAAAELWRNRPEAAPPMVGGRSLLQLVAAVQAALTDNMTPDGPSDHDTLVTLAGLMDCAEQRAAEAQALQVEKDAVLFRFMLRSMDEDSPECAVMVSLADELPVNVTSDQATLAAHLAKGLAKFKAETH